MGARKNLRQLGASLPQVGVFRIVLCAAICRKIGGMVRTQCKTSWSKQERYERESA